jgi:hypothetical protein
VKTQLLCTFAHKSDLNIVSDYIQQSYTIPERRIFVFANAEATDNLYCTYNADAGTQRDRIQLAFIAKKKPIPCIPLMHLMKLFALLITAY